MRSIPQWFVMAWVVVFGAIAVGGSLLAYTFVRDRAAELDSVVDLPELPQLSGGSSEQTDATPTPDTGAAPAGDLTPTLDAAAGDDAAAQATESASDGAEPSSEETLVAVAPWQDPRRVSILLLGIDQRAGETGTFATDTIILLSLDPVGKTGALLSIPRDLWVQMPGLNQPGRINTANIIGDDINYPGGGGPAYAARVVEKELGITIQHYVLINFEVFTTLIDAIGPVEVCPPEPIDDDKYPDGSYGTISIHFDAGCQALEAERLLQYARTRHSDSDIGRSSRQQEVILAVRDKVLSAGGVLSLLPQVPTLWRSVQDNIRTDLTLEEVISLARTAETIPDSEIRQSQISFGEVELGTTADGDQILMPIHSDIQALVQDLFRPPGAPSSREEAAP
jgi:LCP family protein required for cell wall assembly